MEFKEAIKQGRQIGRTGNLRFGISSRADKTPAPETVLWEIEIENKSRMFWIMVEVALARLSGIVSRTERFVTPVRSRINKRIYAQILLLLSGTTTTIPSVPIEKIEKMIAVAVQEMKEDEEWEELHEKTWQKYQEAY